MIKVKADAKRIVSRKGLDSNGRVQKAWTSTVRRMCDPYVPLDSGMLKNTAEERTNEIVYVQPYAKRQFYGHKGRGIRGGRWHERMKAQRRHELLKEAKRIVTLGGKR